MKRSKRSNNHTKRSRTAKRSRARRRSKSRVNQVQQNNTPAFQYCCVDDNFPISGNASASSQKLDKNTTGAFSDFQHGFSQQSNGNDTNQTVLIGELNAIFERYLGLRDDDLALTLIGMSRECSEVGELHKKIQKSDLKELGLPLDMIDQMWDIIKKPSKKL
uniref:GIPC GH2 domain-containing protein n=1 Tax=Acrobeloides nanus TaxID=290746 RepID=A0A914CWD5_9BILA